MLELEKQLENPHDEARVRFLQGRDLTPADLHNKLEDVSYCEEEHDFLLHDPR